MRTFKIFAILAFALLVMTAPLQAQSTTSRTYLVNAITTSTSVPITITVASNTCTNCPASIISGNGLVGLMIDGEYFVVTGAGASATQINVKRGQNGTRAEAHLANAVIWAGNTGNTNSPFISVLPASMRQGGACTAANQQMLPLIDVNTGNVYDCILSGSNLTSNWTAVSNLSYAPSMPYKKLKGTGCAAGDQCTTYTALPTDYIIGYLTTGNGTITLPALTGWYGKEYRIQIETTGTQSVTIAMSATQTINGASTLVFGGSTSFGAVLLYFDGVSKWFALTGK